MSTDPVYGPIYLPEVTIKAKKENPLLMPYNPLLMPYYRHFSKKFSDEVGWNNLSPVERILSLLSVPQAFITYHSTRGKHVTPSKALNINNPVGSFLADALLDVPLPKIKAASTVLGVSSYMDALKRGQNFIDYLKQNILDDLIKKLPNIDSKAYDKDKLLELFRLYSKDKEVPIILPGISWETASLSARYAPDGSLTPVQRIPKNVERPITEARLILPAKEALSSERASESIIHEMAHLYDALSTAASKRGYIGFSNDAFDMLEKVSLKDNIYDRLSKSLMSYDRLSPHKKARILDDYLSEKGRRSIEYLQNFPGEAYPYVLQTLASIQRRSSAPLDKLSRKSFRDVMNTAAASMSYSVPSHTYDRLLRFKDVRQLSDMLYDFMQQYPIMLTKKGI